MIIEETKIPNVTEENIEESKLILSENIIQNVYPLFDEIYSSQVEGIDASNKNLEIKRDKVIQEKNELQVLVDAYKRKKKVAKLLSRIEKLITSGLVYDGALKHETIVLLKICDKLTDEKIDYHLRETLQTIAKRFSR